MSKLYNLLSAMCGKIKKPDWNQNDSAAADYVKNRPFYKRTVFDISWDGNTEGLEQVEINGLFFYKVSDNIPEVTDIAGSALSFDIDNNKYSHTVEQSMITVGTNFLVVSKDIPCILFTYEDQIDINGYVFEKRGCWFVKCGAFTTHSIKKIEIKTMDTEFLPEIPADKLPEIPADKLPEIPAEKLPSGSSIRVIKLLQNISESIGAPTQPTYGVKDLSYEQILKIVNDGNFLLKDDRRYYSPLSFSVDSSGTLAIMIISYSILSGYTGLVYAVLNCNKDTNRFYRNSYYKISLTDG